MMQGPTNIKLQYMFFVCSLFNDAARRTAYRSLESDEWVVVNNELEK